MLYYVLLHDKGALSKFLKIETFQRLFEFLLLPPFCEDQVYGAGYGNYVGGVGGNCHFLCNVFHKKCKILRSVQGISSGLTEKKLKFPGLKRKMAVFKVESFQEDLELTFPHSY